MTLFRRGSGRRPRFALAVALATAAAEAGAQQAPDAPTAAELPPVSVTATRGPRPTDQVPATVSVIEAEQLDRQQAVRPQDAVRYEPGVSFGNNPTRAGGSNFAIRGIGGNRVRVQIDGIRVPDFPESNIGAGNFTRDFVDLETIRRIEILRGPASALYGSDALGGVVAYTTKDPADYLGLTGRDTYVSGRFGYSGADNSFSETITGAFRSGTVEGMLLYTRRDGNELRAGGDYPTNPQDYAVNSLLGRLVWRATPADTLRLTGEFFERLTDTDIRTDRSVAPGFGGGPSTAVLNSEGRDRTERVRLSLDHVRDAPFAFIDRIESRAWYTSLDRRERTDQLRSVFAGPVAPTAPNRFRFSDFRQEQAIVGAETQINSTFRLFGKPHRLTYGAIVERIETGRPRDRFETSLTTGGLTRSVAGETYPNKNFPDTTTWQAGAYVQDEFEVGRLLVVPAVRLDYYNLSPHPDAAFRRSAVVGEAQAVRSQDEVAVSPKLGAVYRLDERFNVYAQYARGFRAPPYDSANFGFTNRVLGYQILPSSDLGPERSDGFEAGFRGRFADGSAFQLVGFYNRYSDFIATRVVGAVAGLTQFRYVNLSDVTIYGAEARGEWRFAPQWAARASAAYARGEDEDTGRPVDGVDPLRFVAGLAWRHPSGWGAEANLTHARRNTRVSEASYFRAPSYTVLDLAAHYDLRPNLTVNVGLFNVTDEKYFITQDVIGLNRTSPVRDLYAQPGRYAALNVTLRW